MRARIWGCRGSMAKPGPTTLRYGGNTSCVEARLEDGSVLVLDAGTGVVDLGVELTSNLPSKIHLLLTHLHMDHIEGLAFFAPLWNPAAVIDVWGPPSPTMSLEERLSRYMSPPLFPVQLSDIPAQATFHDVPDDAWTIGSATIAASAVEHPGPTLGYRITENGRVLAYVPDHEPARVGSIERSSSDWLPGAPIAQGADVLLHDAQYTNDEYADRVSWGHSSFADAVTFAGMCKATRLVLFHHDPSRSDEALEDIEKTAGYIWGSESNGSAPVLAREGMEIDLS
jgi:phosphoribosyl 1,2-cyclic phosphodiesterase